MKNQIAAKTEIHTATEALLEGLIAECHAIIRDDVLPMARGSKDNEKIHYLHAVNSLMESAVALGDAVGRMRGTAPQPELRQRITVERIQRLSNTNREGGGSRS
jgi:hypothetical protein